MTREKGYLFPRLLSTFFPRPDGGICGVDPVRHVYAPQAALPHSGHPRACAHTCQVPEDGDPEVISTYSLPQVQKSGLSKGPPQVLGSVYPGHLRFLLCRKQKLFFRFFFWFLESGGICKKARSRGPFSVQGFFFKRKVNFQWWVPGWVGPRAEAPR